MGVRKAIVSIWGQLIMNTTSTIYISWNTFCYFELSARQGVNTNAMSLRTREYEIRHTWHYSETGR
jgi:hypothetical protein